MGLFSHTPLFKPILTPGAGGLVILQNLAVGRSSIKALTLIGGAVGHHQAFRSIWAAGEEGADPRQRSNRVNQIAGLPRSMLRSIILMLKGPRIRGRDDYLPLVDGGIHFTRS